MCERSAANPDWWKPGLARARDAAAEWHGSPEGRAWHSAHGAATWVGRERETLVCTHCGKEFERFRGVNKRGYCSPSCQGMARKQSGVDDVDRQCSVCGGNFRVNRYSKTKTCSKDCWRKALSLARTASSVRLDSTTGA
jgi:endogenous inhibitor of DNA gyrase (YacG/DUF329 family)